jgi:hypothetical protein
VNRPVHNMTAFNVSPPAAFIQCPTNAFTCQLPWRFFFLFATPQWRPKKRCIRRHSGLKTRAKGIEIKRSSEAKTSSLFYLFLPKTPAKLIPGTTHAMHSGTNGRNKTTTLMSKLPPVSKSRSHLSCTIVMSVRKGLVNQLRHNQKPQSHCKRCQRWCLLVVRQVGEVIDTFPHVEVWTFYWHDLGKRYKMGGRLKCEKNVWTICDAKVTGNGGHSIKNNPPELHVIT